MCYGISGTVDDKGVVRTQFTCSHDHKENKPDEDRRIYWEWETHYPFKTAVFTNIGEIQPNGSKLPEPDETLKQKVEKFIKDNRAKIALALLEQVEGKGMELMDKSRNNDLCFQESRNGDLYFQESKNDNLCFWESKNGDLYFCWSKNGDLNLRNATIGKGGDVRFLKTGWKKADKFIRKLSKSPEEIPLGRLIELAYELGKKRRKHDQTPNNTPEPRL